MSYKFFLVIGFLLASLGSFAQENRQDLLNSIFVDLPTTERGYVSVIVSPEKPQECQPIYTNVISNTNLFSNSEKNLVADIVEKYKNIGTNSGPVGTRFKDWLPMRIVRPQLTVDTTTISQVAVFIATNSSAKVQVAAFYQNRIVLARFRDSSNNGYDVSIYDGVVTAIQQYKNGVLDGLFLSVNNPNHLNSNSTIKCLSLLRLNDGKAVGKYFGWQEDGKIGIELEFKMPFDFMKYQPVRYDFLWVEADTDAVYSPSGINLNLPRQP